MALTPEQKRAKDAERKRVARAKQREARDAERAKARTRSDASAGRAMRDALDSALAAMRWIVPSDAASVAQARALALLIDETTHEGDRVRALTAHRALSKVLADLGGTPTVRMQHELRSLKLAAKVEGGEHGGNTAQGSNVSKFERPPKRKA